VQNSTTNPNFGALLVEAVSKPGLILDAYSQFHNYSLGNQLLALTQCFQRKIELGPINTFPGWHDLGRPVKKGERALTLCMPITCKRKESGDDDGGGTFTAFVLKPRWFVLAQTEGQEFVRVSIPEWDADRALKALDIERIAFQQTDGNCQGYARKRQIAINPIAQLPHKTFFHESGHVLLGHTAEADFNDDEHTPRSLREVEGEAVALLCCEALKLEGPEYRRGYIQHWIGRGGNSAIPERSAQKIFKTADQILKAGRTA
jgi:hypothetical protein